MILAGDIVFYLIALILMVPAALLCAECVAALLPRQVPARAPVRGLRTVVIVPAHNEAAVIGACLASVQPQLREQDRLVVVADNCADETAALARGCGAVVIERRQPDRHGKGFALDYGLRFVALDPPDIVIVLDADCVVQSRLIEQLAAQVFLTGRPAQAAYVLQPPAHPRPGALISAFAFAVKNVVRPLGLTRLGMPCLLTGTGMAFPWSALAGVSLASSKTAEDMQLAIDLALTGHPPLFCPGAVVSGCLPALERTARNQRTLWEHGHLATMVENAPRLLSAAFRQRRLSLLAMGFDVLVPPLSLFVLLWTMATGASVLWGAATGLWGSTALMAIAGLFICLGVSASWAVCGRSMVPLSALWTIPLYVASKVPLYLAFLVSPRNQWVLREREKFDR